MARNKNMNNCILRGVPSSLRQDGWWLGPITPVKLAAIRPRAAQNLPGGTRRYALQAILLAGLIALTQLPGVSKSPEVGELGVTRACSGAEDLDFRAAPGLRSFVPVSQQGVTL